MTTKQAEQMCFTMDAHELKRTIKQVGNMKLIQNDSSVLTFQCGKRAYEVMYSIIHNGEETKRTVSISAKYCEEKEINIRDSENIQMVYWLFGYSAEPDILKKTIIHDGYITLFAEAVEDFQNTFNALDRLECYVDSFLETQRE